MLTFAALLCCRQAAATPSFAGLACLQVYPAVMSDASKLIQLLKPIRCSPSPSPPACAGVVWHVDSGGLCEGRTGMLHWHAPTACLTSGTIGCACRDKDPREDLKTLARMYCTGLEMQMRDKAR